MALVIIKPEVQAGAEHPNLSAHNTLGLATDAELAAHAATPHSGRVAPLVHTQSVASASWTVTHNLGYKPTVDILTTSDEQMFPDVVHSSNNAYSVIFATPATGTALSR